MSIINTIKYFLFDEEYAINQYVSSTAYNLNEKLRNNLPLTADEEKIKINLNNALNKLLKYQGIVVRDLYFDDEAELEKFKKGYSLGNNGYSSSIIMKTVESDIDGYNEFIVNEIDKFKSEYSDLNVEKDINLINKFCKMLLEKGEKYGFEIVKG